MCFAPQQRALAQHVNFQSGPSIVRLVRFDLDMSFAPQQRALNFQKWSEHGVFCAFWLGNVLGTTTACTFSTLQLPKVARSWRVLYILTSKRASRHNGVQFFISHLAKWLRTRRFSEPTFRPSGATNHWKNLVNCHFSTFSHTCIFFLLTLSLLWSSLFFSSLLWLSPSLPFHLSILSEVSLLNFLRLDYTPPGCSSTSFDMLKMMMNHWCFFSRTVRTVPSIFRQNQVGSQWHDWAQPPPDTVKPLQRSAPQQSFSPVLEGQAVSLNTGIYVC